ncbi:hypothetical protein TIFTF001_014929 [Ficus carica]|uniref:RING-type E3 ubiquitin transferase n=1 Tax=Ficus carica TaxID=3494 RepID=A0AA88DIJ5_FICCA|nr:hypothetical protein TIFTF001_014929 [Ficus carica]
MSTYGCEVWQPDQSTNLAWTSPNPEFLIDVFATYATVEDDDPSISTSYTRYLQFIAQRQDFLDNSTSWLTISNMLSHMLVPFHAQPSMIQKISTCAREIASLPGNVDSKTIPLVVCLVVGHEEEEVREDSDGTVAQERSPAVQVLERMSIEGYCVICLEEILLGCEASRLPCLHFYHECCILRWLEKSNLCPLCRFELPLD